MMTASLPLACPFHRPLFSLLRATEPAQTSRMKWEINKIFGKNFLHLHVTYLRIPHVQLNETCLY